MENNYTEDFRTLFYKNYVSKFKELTDQENPERMKSDYKVYDRRFLPLIVSFPKNSRILDLGCGSGYMLNYLRQKGFIDLYGIDISEEQIERLKARKINGEVQSVFDFLTATNNKFDIIFAMDIIEHFAKEELIPFFSGISRILNSNGILVIHTPNGQSPFALNHIYGDLTHLTIFNPTSLIQILSYTGFNKIQFFESGPTTKSVKSTIRLILWKIIRIFLMGIRTVENGTSENILTQDFICTARKH